MDFLTFLVRIVEALAWPAILAIAFWQLRGKLGDLILRLQKLKYKDGEATFAEELTKVEIASGPIAEKPELTVLPGVAGLPPSYIIIQAWNKLDHAYLELKKRLPSPLPRNAVRDLLKTGFNEAEYIELQDLKRLKDRALHNKDDVTMTDALRYRDLASKLESYFKSLPKPPE